MKPREYKPEILFQVLADRTRLRILNLMDDDEICVCFLVAIIGPNQPKISRHLAYLRKAGVVECRRDGKWAHYRIVTPADPAAAQVLDHIRKWIADEPEMKKDREQLLQVCCAPQPPIILRSAPRPSGIKSSCSS